MLNKDMVWKSRQFEYFEQEIAPGSFIFTRFDSINKQYQICSGYILENNKHRPIYSSFAYGQALKREFYIFNFAQREYLDFLPEQCRRSSFPTSA